MQKGLKAAMWQAVLTQPRFIAFRDVERPVIDQT
jgi:hypothetical protein